MAKKSPKNFGTIKVRIQLPSNDDERAIVGGVNDNIESFGADLATGLMSIVTGNTQKLKIGDFTSKINSTVTVYDYVENISTISEKIYTSIQNIAESISEKGILGDIRDTILDWYFSTSDNESPNTKNSIDIAIDTSKAKNLSEIIESINSLVGDAKEVNMEGLNYLEKFFTKLQSMTGEDGIITKAIEGTNTIPSLSKAANKNIHALSALFTALNNLMSLDTTAVNNNVSQLTEVFTNIEKVLTEVSELDIDDKIQPIKERLERIRDLYDNDIEITATAINSHTKDVEAIKDGTNDAYDVAITGEEVDEDDLEDSIEGAAHLVTAIAALGFVMIIGGLIISIYRPLIEASLYFGLALSGFLLLLMPPIALISFIVGKLGTPEDLESLTDFIVTSSLLMVIGAVIFLIPGLVDKSLMFGKVLSAFLLTLMLPIALLTFFSKGSVMKSLDKLSIFLLTCTGIMAIGALFMLSSVFPKNSLEFGKHLALFIGLILLPFASLGVFILLAGKILEYFSQVVITATIVMLIGALFIYAGGGKYLVGAFAFGLALSAFIALLLWPIAAFAKRLIFSFWTIKQLRKFVLWTTIIMMIGAFFMMQKNMVMGALLFPIMLTLFIGLILWPLKFYALALRKSYLTVKLLASFILITGTLFLIGAYMMMKQPMLIVFGLAFALTLAIFIGLILLPFKIFEKTLRKAFPSLLLLSIFVLACGITIGIGAYIFEKYNISAILGATLIAAFVFLMVLAVRLLIGGGGMKGLSLKSTINAMYIMLAIAALCLVVSVAIYIVAKSGATIETFEILAKMFAIVTLMTVMIRYLVAGKRSLTKQQLSTAIMLMGAIAIMLLVTALSLAIVKLSGADQETFEILAKMFAIVSGMVILVRYIIKGLKKDEAFEAMLIILSITSVLLVASFALWIVKQSGADLETVKILGYMTAAISALAIIVLFITKKIKPEDAIEAVLILGILCAVVLSVSIALWIVKQSGADVETFKIIGLTSLIIVGLLALVALITKIPKTDLLLGSICLGIMTAIVVALSFAISLVSKSGATKETVGIIGLMSLIIAGLAGLAILLGLNSINPLFWAGIVIVGVLTGLLFAITGVIYLAANAALAIEKIKEPDKLQEKITKIFDAFINSIPSFGVIEFIRLLGAVNRVKAIAMPLAQTMMIIGRAVSDIASLKVAMAWDKDGNPTSYRQLSENDFTLAANGVYKIITTLSEGIFKAAEYYDKIDTKLLWKTLIASRYLGKVIGSIADGMISFAQLMIPIAWNNDGVAIKYRQITDSDFDLAVRNISKIITTLAVPIMELAADPNFASAFEEVTNSYSKGWGRKEVITTPSPFMRVLTGCITLGDMIGSIAQGIGAFAAMSIPIKWNDDGKPIKFRRLTDNEISGAIDNIKKIIESIVIPIVALADSPTGDLFKEVTETRSKGWGRKENITRASTFMQVLTGCLVLSEFISNLSTGIKGFATMMIPNQWDPKTGKPIHYTKITDGELKATGVVVGDIVVILAKAIKDAYIKFRGILSPEDFKKVTESFVPMGQLIGGLADGIGKLAQLQVAKNWDKDGNPTEYRKLTPIDFYLAGINVGIIVTTLGGALAYAHKKLLKEMPPEKFKAIVESFVPMGELISNLSGNIADYATGKFTGADGKVVQLDPKTDFENAANNIASLLRTIAKGFIDFYNEKGNAEFFGSGEKSLLNITTTFGEINSLMKDVSELMKQYADISDSKITTSLNNIDIILNGKENQNSLLNIVKTAFTDITEDDFKNVVPILSIFGTILTTLFEVILKPLDENSKIITKVMNIKKVDKDSEGHGIFGDIQTILTDISVTMLVTSAVLSVINELSPQGVSVLVDDTISMLCSFATVIGGFNYIIPMMQELQTTINSVEIKNDIAINIANTLTTINAIFDVINGDINPADVATNSISSIYHKIYRKPKDKTSDYIASAFKLSNKLFALNLVLIGLQQSVNMINKFTSINFDNLVDLLVSSMMISSTMDILENTFNSKEIDPFGSISSLIILKEKIYTFSEIVNKMIEASSGNIKNNLIFKQIANGIETINKPIEELDATKTKSLANEVETIDKFVKTIDKVNMGKVNGIKSLIDSMNDLASKAAGFDKIVKLLDGDLTNTIAELGEKLDEMKKTIDTANTIDRRRKSELKENIAELHKIMKENIHVGVGELDKDGTIKLKSEKTK